MIVIGDGLIAREFKKSEKDDHIVIIASGVSNSKEERKEEFDREESLVREVIDNYREKKIIYFSTCSILQNSRSPYIDHKLKMEKILRASNVCFQIFRLPQVVGFVNNNTIISFMVRNLFLNNPVQIQEDAFRNLIDIEDVARVVNLIVRSENDSALFNIASSFPLKVTNICDEIAKITESKSDVKIIEGGESYHIDNSSLKKYLGNSDVIFSNSYPVNVLEKYTLKLIKKYKISWLNG